MEKILNSTTENKIKYVVEQNMETTVERIYPIGNGASGCVYCVEIKSHPYKIAVKMSEHHDAMVREKEMLDYLSSRVSFKVPKTYFVTLKNNVAYLGMEFIEGISGLMRWVTNILISVQRI